MDSKHLSPKAAPRGAAFGLMFLLLALGLGLLFYRALLPGHTLFSNDGPLGNLMMQCHRLPAAFTGGWEDLNTIGTREGGAFPNISFGLEYLLGPLGFSKLYAPVALLILGLGAWCFFRQLGLTPVACLLGGLAAALNSGFFSAACWGVAAHPLTIGMNFFALAALARPHSRWRWLRVVLAGLCVGMGVSEGADVGAIFSLYTAAFLIYQAFTTEGPRTQNLTRGFLQLGLVALCAAFLAAQTVAVLVETQIKGVAGTGQDSQTKEQHWDFATQWSLPKREALGIFVPGVFGYRMDTPAGGVYWGAVGRDPNWDRWFGSGKQGQPPAGPLRYTGGGNYAGILVGLVACWAALQSFRKKDSVFSLANRRWLWFWSGVAFLSLLLAFGRFAPFYRLLYALPYFSTIRNPAKFTHLVNWALVVLFAYGVHGLWCRYLQAPAPAKPASLRERLSSWWRQVRGFDRRWTLGCLAALGASALGWLIFSSSRDNFVQYLQEVGFDQGMAQAVAQFSSGQWGWFLVLFAVAISLVVLVISGALSGPRARWAGVLLGLFLVADLGRANQPWIIVWDYQQKYATNPVLERLRQQPYEHRVAILPGWIYQAMGAGSDADLLNMLYGQEWAQHHFLYYNIQSLDLVQMPRMPEDLIAFEMAFQPRSMADVSRVVARRWQLTNTRYLLGTASTVDFLNQQLDLDKQRFRIAQRFQIVPKPGLAQATGLEEVTASPDPNGKFALIEFTGALPRAKLYTNWQTRTNDQAAVQELASASFHPEQTVLVDQPAPAPGTEPKPGTVEFTGYAPKDIQLKAQASAPSVLLLNDRYDPNWKVWVDGKPEPLLRCNYLMRGVYLPPGTHQVEFRFEPPTGTLYVSLAAIIFGVLLSGILLVVRDPVAPEPCDVSPVSPQPSKVASR